MFVRLCHVLFLFLLPYVAVADYSSDQCGLQRSTGADARELPIRRLYIARIGAHECVGRTLETCGAKYGQPVRQDIFGDGEQLLTFRGNKMLYRGTGEKSVPVEREWMEVRVSAGRVIEAMLAVQILEQELPWESDPLQSAGAVVHWFTYEKYGLCERDSVTKIAPVEPIPRLPARLPVAESMSDSTIEQLFMALTMLNSCAVISKDFAGKIDSAQKQMASEVAKQDASELVELMIASPIYARWQTHFVKELEIRSEKEKQKKIARCNSVFAAIDKRIKGADPRFASPQKTWTHFIASLKTGDKQAVIDCFTAESQFRDWFHSMSEMNMKAMAESVKAVQFTDKVGESFYEAVISKQDGSAGFVYFVDSDGEWKIDSM